MDDLGFARDDAEAAVRARLHRNTDPFAEIAASLLHMEHVRQYVAKTGMIWPFDDSPDHRKCAAYEVKVKGKCIYWDEHGTKIPLDLADGVEFRLKPNSIAFVTLEPRFRLPNYIAVRFNLKVTHVYRGLLAGTGPLVDPGYDNFLFVPIHNLTTNDYIIRGGDPLVWMEFTKVAPISSEVSEAFKSKSLPSAAAEKPADLEFYLRKADPNRAIRSSIPEAIGNAIRIAREAMARVTQLSYAAAIGILVGLVGAVLPVVELIKDAQSLNLAAIEKLDEVKRIQATMSEQQRQTDARFASLQKELATLRARQR